MIEWMGQSEKDYEEGIGRSSFTASKEVHTANQCICWSDEPKVFRLHV